MILITFILFILVLPFSLDGFIQASSFFFLPAFISTVTIPVMRGYQEKVNIRQSALMALVTLGTVAILMMFYINFGTNIKIAMIVSYGVTISFRYVIFRGIFISDAVKSIPYTFFNSLIALPFIHLFLPLESYDLVIFSLIALISLSSIEAFIASMNRPFLKNFDTSTMDLIRTSFQLFIEKEKGKKGLEEIFKKNEIRADIEYTFFSFKNKDKIKAVFIIPNLHPGPMKGIAGSNLPEILAKDLKGYGEIFTFHGPSTHMLNPIIKEDCSKISKGIMEKIGKLEYDEYGTHFNFDDSGVSIGSQLFGDGLFMTASFSPRPTEDIDAPIGKIVKLKAQELGFEKVGFVDAHNCVKKGCTEIYYPSTRYRAILEKVKVSINKMRDKGEGKIRMGIASKKDYSKSKGIAGEGIKVSVFEIDGKKNAYILVDGNNMVRGIREEIQDNISDLVLNSEVTTTDSHEVNTLNKDYNPVGLEMDENKIIEEVRELVLEAIEDLEDVKVGTDDGVLKNMSVMGPINSNRLNAVAETIYQMAPITLGLAVLVQALSTLLIIMVL